MLRTWDLGRTVDFWTGVLGFTCTERSGSWATLRHGDVEVMVSAPNAHDGLGEATFSGSLYFRLADAAAVDRAWDALGGRATCCYPPETFPYGMREFAVYDDSGYVLQFGAPAGP
jgi:uncharacterized glyoxalase superfamily protein PhnB